MTTGAAPDPLFQILEGVNFASELETLRGDRRASMRRVLLGFLGVLDALDRVTGRDDDRSTLGLVRRRLVGAFEEAGVQFFATVGLPFDPCRHEAVEVRSGEWVDEIVVEEISRGCEWEGELLRSAQVVVARGAAAGERSEEECHGQGDRD